MMVNIIRSVLCVLLVCTTLYPAYASTEYVGTLAGEFRVAESGAATYTVPITVPKARGDVAPQIALQYHSHNTREGLLGVGWQLSASSAITRCPSTPIVDGTITPIYFDTRDHFCLDGQRLVVGSGQKGHDGTTYHTDIDNFAVITSFDDNHDGHPRYFSVQTKSGETHYYGDASHAPYPYRGEDALVLHPEQPHVAKAWMLKAIEDVAGNYIEFHYQSSAMSSAMKGAALLSHIQYGGHIQGDAPYIDVRFEYEHTGTGFSGYYFGMPVRNDQRLTDITVLQDGHTYRKYTLNYDVAAHLQAKTTLTSIVECAPRSGQQLSLRCKPATQFAWHGVPDTPYYQPFASAERWLSHHSYAEHRLFDINGDGVDDVVYEKDGAWRARITHYGDIHLSHVGAGSKERSYAMAFDGNVDGVMDLLVFHGSTVMYVYLDVHSRPVQVNTQMHIPFTDYQRGVISADVNGDGRSDLVYQQSGHVRALINPTGQGRWQRITLHAFAADDVVNLRLFDEAKDTTAAFDVNGDGRTDFVFELQKREYYCVFSGPIFNPRSMPRPLAEPAISTMRTEFDAFAPAEPGLDAGLDNSGQFECMRRGGRWVSQRYTTQEMFVSSGDMATPRLTANGTLGTASTEQMRPVDINGDGLSDIMYTLNGTWFYRISTGTYFRQGQSTGLSASNALSHRTHFVDINGDGRTDILHASRETQLDIYMSSPIDGVSDRVSFSRTGTRHVSANARIHLGLLNRDNHIDVLTYQRGTWSVYWGQQHPAVDTIHTITNGFGVSTEIDYRAQSDPAVYTLTQPRHSLPEQVIAPARGPNLVYQVHTDSNVDIDSYTKERLSVRYHYRDALLHIAGRGVLGFGELQTQDRQTGVITTTSYHQDASGQQYALIGMPLATTQTLNGNVLSTSTNTLAVKTTATDSLFPYIASSTDSIIHVDDDAQAVHEVGAIHTTYEYDDYGNLTYSKTEQYDRRASGYTPYLRTETTNTYGSDENMQRLGRLTKTQVTHSSNVAGTNKRQSVFTYQANGLLQSSIVYGDSVTGNYHAQDPRYVGHHLKTLYAYDAYGQQTAQCTTDDITQTQVPDASSQSGARCARTEYSDDGRVISASINSLGERTTLDYDASHGQHLGIIYQVTTTTDNGVSTRVHLDGFGRQVATTLPNGLIQRTSMGYTSSYAAHFYEQRTQPGQAPLTVYYDVWGREVASVTRKRQVNDDYQYIVVKKTYDNQGRLSTVSQPNDFTATTTTAYDVLGRPTSVTRPAGQVETVSRINGATITTNALGQVHTEQRDPFGQLRSTTDNLGNEVFFTYDVMGNLTRTSNSYNNQVIVNTYDSWGRKISTTDPDKGTWRYKYNHYGELIEQTDAIGHRYDFTYDSLGRMVRRYSPSEGTSCWRYGSTSHRNIHASGKLLSKSLYTSRNITCSDTRYTPSSQESYVYDDLGRVSGITRLIHGQTFSESMTYNNLGQVSEITYPTGTEAFTVTHEYDDEGDLRYVRHKSTDTLLWQASAFNRRGLITKAAFGNQTTTEYGYTTEGFHETSATKRNHTLLYESVVTLDDAGNVTQRESHYRARNGLIDSFTETYAYDALNRLTSRGFAQDKRGYTPSHFSTSVTYRYDNAGNMTYKSDVGTYHYDSTKPNRLVKVTNYRGQQIKAFTYDNNGNVTAETNLRGFRYTAFDKPYRITHRNGAVVDMSYNIDRNMVFKRDSRKVSGTQTTTEHYYAGGYEKIVQTQGRSPGLVEHKYHLMGGNIVITHRSNGTKDTHYLHKDTQGSVSLITNESGSAIAQYIYDPFGKQTTLSTHSLFAQAIYHAPSHQGYTGHHELSDVGIIHMNGRIYDPTLGRFLQADPFIQAPMNSQNYNRYSYVLNNPMSMTDPSGYFFKWLGKKIKKYWRPIVAIVAAYYGYTQGLEWFSSTATVSTTTTATTTTAFGTVATTSTVTSTFTYASTSAYIGAGALGGAIGGAIATGSLRGAFTGTVAGAFGGWANTYSLTTLGGSTASIAISATGGCLAGKASGGVCSQGAKLAAMAQALKVGLDNIAGDQSSLKTSDGEAVVKPGGQLKADMLANGENVDWINSSIDNTGMGVTVNDPKYRFLIGKPVSEARTILQSMGHNSSTVLNNLGMAGESGRFMSLLSQNIGGVRSSSVMHDRLVGLVERGLGMESTWYGTAFTVGSIPPAFYAQYTAFGAHAYDYYYRNLKR